jgi:hypothetical protein
MLQNVLRTGALGQEPTVFDDDACDTLFGSLGRDWFLANVTGSGVWDWIDSPGPDELVDDLLRA